MVGVDTIDATIAGPVGAITRTGARTSMGARTEANLLVHHTILKGIPPSLDLKGQAYTDKVLLDPGNWRHYSMNTHHPLMNSW